MIITLPLDEGVATVHMIKAAQAGLYPDPQPKTTTPTVEPPDCTPVYNTAESL